MIELNYKKYGQGSSNLVILHGLFGMLDNWHTLATQFAEKYTVWLVDQRNHGKSPHKNEFSYDVLAEDLKHFFGTHNMEKAHIIGHSMGGKTAMEFAIKYPELVNKLIVADIAPKAYDARHDEILEALQGLELDKFSKRTVAEEALAERIDSNAVRQFLLKNLTREGNGYRWKMNLPALVENYPSIIGGIKSGVYEGDTLFIKGERSKYILDEDKPQILEQFPAAKFVTMHNVGHWLHAEAPDVFHDIVVGFLEK